jgi:hypothetical protein
VAEFISTCIFLVEKSGDIIRKIEETGLPYSPADVSFNSSSPLPNEVTPACRMIGRAGGANPVPVDRAASLHTIKQGLETVFPGLTLKSEQFNLSHRDKDELKEYTEDL